ncbi:MAG: YihY family inner membrane protein [Burkholderiales bacterium]
MRPLRDFRDFCAAVAQRMLDERAMLTAGSLTYTTLLSLVPLFTVALAVSTAFPVFDQAVDALQTFVFQNFLPDAKGVDTIAQQITSFTQNAGRLTAIGTAFFVVTAVMLMLTIDDALTRIFRVQRRRPLLQRVLMYWGVLTLGPVLIGGSLSTTSFAVGASFGVLNLHYVAEAVLRVLPFVFTCAALTLLYAVVPYRYVELRHAFAGALAAGIAFEVAKRAFATYLAWFPTYRLIYGAFATIPIFLIWLYISWLVVLAGAAFAAVLPGYHGASLERNRPPGQDLADALAVLAILTRAHAEGRIVRLRHLARRLRVLPYRCEQVLERAAALGWAVRTDKDGWVLSHDPGTISVADAYRAFAIDDAAMGVREADLTLSLREYAERERKE